MTDRYCQAPATVRPPGAEGRPCGKSLMYVNSFLVETLMGNILEVCPACYKAMVQKGMVRREVKE